MKYLHYNHVVAADAFSDSPDYLHGIIKFGDESSVGAAPRGRPLSLIKQTRQLFDKQRR